MVNQTQAARRRPKRTEKLDLRLSLSAKQSLQAAARAIDKSVSEFVLESALVRAEEVIADRQEFRLSAADWEAFWAALDAPDRALPRVRRLFREPSVFEVNDAT